MRPWVMRRSVVRRISEVAFPVLLVACTPVGTESQTTEPVEPAPAVEAAPAVADQPESVAPVRPPVDPSTQPKLEVVARKLDADQRELGLCRFHVRHHAFPAISDDGTTLVAAQTIQSDRVSGETFVELTWLAAEATRVEPIYNHDGAKPWREDDVNCDIAVERVREKVAAFNTELAAHTWRPLEPLDALFSKPGIKAVRELLPGGGEFADLDEVLGSLAGADRPVEVYYHGGHFLARVRDLKVLQKTSRPEWRHSAYNNEFCGEQVLISAIDFDRASRLALVHYNFDAEGGCLCDDPGSFGRIELSPELLAEAELRSTEKFMTAYKLATEEVM
jgi:hypothetical protein